MLIDPRGKGAGAAAASAENLLLAKDSLSIDHVQAGQKGSYQCRAKNQIGEESSNVITLDVKCK